MPTLTHTRRITEGSVEFLTIWLDSAGTATLSAQPIAIALTASNRNPDVTTTWRTAAWTGSAGTARGAAILIGPGTSHVIPKGTYNVWSKLTDSPEVPETFHGRLTVY